MVFDAPKTYLHNHSMRQTLVKPSKIHAFLCPSCDQTHLQIDFDDGSASISLAMNPMKAEGLAADLINPKLVDPADMA